MQSTKEIGKIFSETREKKNITVEEAYGKSRIHPSVIKNIESGQFQNIEKPYLRSFLKKYAAFLGMNTESILQKYEEVSSSVPIREFSLSKEEKKEKKEKEEKKEIFTNFTEEKLKKVFTAVLSAVLVLLIFTLVSIVKSKLSVGDRQGKVASVRGEKAALQVPASESSVVSAVTLTLKARGKVWVQVNEGNKMLFASILKKGQSRTWKSNDTLTVWTGKADELDFIVNDRGINSFATGVVKNIQVSSQGIKVGDVWKTKLD